QGAKCSGRQRIGNNRSGQQSGRNHGSQNAHRRSPYITTQRGEGRLIPLGSPNSRRTAAYHCPNTFDKTAKRGSWSPISFVCDTTELNGCSESFGRPHLG